MAYIDAGRTAALQGIDPEQAGPSELVPQRPSRRLRLSRQPKANKATVSSRGTRGWDGKFPRCSPGNALAGGLRRCTSIRSPKSTWIRNARGRVCLTGDAAPGAPRHARGMGTTLALVGSYVLAHEMQAAGLTITPRRSPRYRRLLAPYVRAVCQKLAIQRPEKPNASSSGRPRHAAQTSLFGCSASQPSASWSPGKSLAGGAFIQPAELLSCPAVAAGGRQRKRPAPSVASGGYPGDAGEFVVQRLSVFGYPPLMQRR